MHDQARDPIMTLREQAAHCREIAHNVFSACIARELLAIAAEYEREADALERQDDELHDA